MNDARRRRHHREVVVTRDLLRANDAGQGEERKNEGAFDGAAAWANDARWDRAD